MSLMKAPIFTFMNSYNLKYGAKKDSKIHKSKDQQIKQSNKRTFTNIERQHF